ncbi:hypothetical protein ACWD5R_44765 [Streptomyces sp. NPDC002514]|uniref:hypothetical protein n=1 Tax=Streptomyces sp. NPDC001270 TaxID=3364554 RepID=UPI0036B35034
MSVDGERERWELRSGVGVGPLHFGMSPAEVAEALLVSEPQARIGGPYEQEDFSDGVKAFYDAGKLACVALDAVMGPQVFLADFPLAGGDPGQVSAYTVTSPASYG